MTVTEILASWLKANGYDGLYYWNYECGCSLDDFVPCSELSENCEAGYKIPCECGDNCDFHIGPKSEDGE
jgi:hypothetical protein